MRNSSLSLSLSRTKPKRYLGSALPSQIFIFPITPFLLSLSYNALLITLSCLTPPNAWPAPPATAPQLPPPPPPQPQVLP